MPFIRPAVHVYQQLMTITPRTISPFFELCLIGPSYQVVRKAQFPDFKSSNSPTYNVPYTGLDTSASVVADSITAVMKNISAQIWPASTSVVAGELKVSNIDQATVVYNDASSTFTSAGVRVGDLIDVTFNGLSYSSIVQEIAVSNQNVAGAIVPRETITLQKNIPTPTLDTVTVAGSSTTTLKFSSGASTTADYYNGMSINIGGVVKTVTDYAYAAGVGTLTLNTALASAPDAGIPFIITGVGALSTIYRPVAKKIWPARYSTNSIAGNVAVSLVNGVSRLTFDTGDLSVVNVKDSVRVVYTRGSNSEQFMSEAKAINVSGTKYIDLKDVLPTPGTGVTVSVYTTTSEFRHNVTLDNSGGLSRITTDIGAKFTIAGVAVKDRVRLYDGNIEYSAEVYSISADGRTITLSNKVAASNTYGVVQAIINRDEIDQYTLLKTEYTAGTDNFEIDNKIIMVVDTIERLMYSASVFVDYKALRVGNGEFVQVNTTADSLAAFGPVDPENPMAIACSMVHANSGVSFKVLPITEDSTAGYLAALDTLTTSEKVYVMVPLSQDKDVVSAYAAHCTTMSAPEKSRWRIMYGNMMLPVSKVMVEFNAGTLANGEDDFMYLKDTVNGAFVSSACSAGDFVELFTYNSESKVPLTDGKGNAYALKIKSIINDTVARVYSNLYIKTSEGYSPITGDHTIVPDEGGTEQSINYEVRRILTNSGIAEEMVAIARSFSNKRLRIVMPDEVIIAIDNVDYVLPGYYLAVAYGAMRAGLPPHQGFTTLGVSGISRILHSNKKFKDTELDEMAGGGIFWVVQDEPEALPYCIYQTTTDTTQLETIEDSVVATIDYASKYFKDNLKAVLGKFNVNEISTKFVATVIKDVGEKLMRTSYPYIGSILTESKLKSITSEADKIIPVVTVKVPFPVNAVDLCLQV